MARKIESRVIKISIQNKIVENINLIKQYTIIYNILATQQ